MKRTAEQRRWGRSVFVCPFCGIDGGAFAPHELCGGAFTDRDHPSAVRPILIDLDTGDQPFPGSRVRLDEAKASYGSKS
jgi:hypothetical protein